MKSNISKTLTKARSILSRNTENDPNKYFPSRQIVCHKKLCSKNNLFSNPITLNK